MEERRRKKRRLLEKEKSAKMRVNMIKQLWVSNVLFSKFQKSKDKRLNARNRTYVFLDFSQCMLKERDENLKIELKILKQEHYQEFYQQIHRMVQVRKGINKSRSKCKS